MCNNNNDNDNNNNDNNSLFILGNNLQLKAIQNRKNKSFAHK